MINLIRNELCKILHKKGIYIYTILIIMMLVLMTVVSKNVGPEDDSVFLIEQADMLEDNLKNYDLDDEHELDMYIGDRVIIDVYRLSSEYDINSQERYYIDEIIEPLIYSKYQFEYAENNIDSAKEMQASIDEAIKRLDNFDWKKDIKDRIVQIEAELDTLDKSKDSVLIETLNIELWCLNYRLDNNVPYSYGHTSMMIDEYEDYAVQYLSVVKDESLIVDKEVLREKREVEKNYYELQYKLEHKIVGDNQEMIDFIVSSMAYVDDLIIVAIIIVAGSIVSSEFNKGTIKQLLIKPHSRTKILLSKIIASLIVIFLFCIVYNGAVIIANCYEYSDFTSIFGNNVVYDFSIGKVREVSVLSQCLYGFVSVLPAYLIIFFFVIFMGVLTTSTISTVSSTFGVYLFYDLLSLWLKPKVLAYLPFYCWDLSPYMYGGLNSNIHSSFGLALLVDIVTILVLMLLAFIIFKKKEIKNQ